MDDSQVTVRLLCTEIETRVRVQTESAYSLAETKQLLAHNAERFFIAILDLTLPDANDGEVVDFVQSFKIPVIVLTGRWSNDLRAQLINKHVIDYVAKSNPGEIQHVVSLVARVHHNHEIQVLVVDDSKSFRHYIKTLLHIHRYTALEATNGRQALTILAQYPGISLVITDVNMPEMDGISLITEIRKRYTRSQLAVIGISDRDNTELSAKLLKTGANDFITKPFQIEEFYIRITQNVETIEHIKEIEESATRDYLTRAYNRKYLFESGETLYQNAKRGNVSMAVAVVDADHFKNINDSYGHYAGDQALIHLVSVLQEQVRKSDMVARYGGEEFVVLATGISKDALFLTFDRIRQAVQDIEIRSSDYVFNITASIGVTMDLCESLEEMINRADKALYTAKNEGRNRVVVN